MIRVAVVETLTHDINLRVLIHQLKKQLAKGQDATPQLFAETIKNLNLSNSVFVDCTASYDVAAVYDTMLENNVSVVTANKIASSSAYAHYRKLKQTAKDKGVRFHYETNVGAAYHNIANKDLIKSRSYCKTRSVFIWNINFIVTNYRPTNLLSVVIARLRRESTLSQSSHLT